MAEHPILFSGPMVRAILAGRKTQTRRVVKVQLEYDGGSYWQDGTGALHLIETLCPYGVPGDRLWVRETWFPYLFARRQVGICYKADTSAPEQTNIVSSVEYAKMLDIHQRGKCMPSIYMPRWASRINLEITGVRVERLQSISEADAIAEGIEWTPRGPLHAHALVNDGGVKYWRNTETARECYQHLWDTINGKRAPWASNPWVWVVEFKRVTS